MRHRLQPAAVAAAIATTLAAAFVATAQAAPVSATGSPIVDGWGPTQGNSTQAGTFVRGAGLNGAPYDFNVYATTYTLQAGSNLLGGSWLVGDTVLGLGGAMVQTYDVTFRAVLKFGGAASQYSPATQNIGNCTGAACGPTSRGSHSAGDGGEGSVQIGFNYVRSNGDIGAGQNGALLAPENFSYYDNAAITYDANASVRDLARIVASFDTVGNDRVLSWEGLLNVSAMARNAVFVGNDLPAVGAGSIVTFQRSTGDFTDALANAAAVAAVPAPATLPLTMLAIGALALTTRRRRDLR